MSVLLASSVLPSVAQDQLARLAPVDRKLKVLDTLALQSALEREQYEMPAANLYSDWDNRYAHKATELPDSFRINLRGFRMPTPSRVITSNFGPRWGRQHKGLDIKVYIGDTIRAAFSGKVRVVRYEAKGYGNYVVIRHNNGLETIYGHLSRFLVKPDQYVKAGQPIALSGNTGRSTGPHLHFETRFMGYAINPEAIFDFGNRCTHTDSYTFTKTNYTKARDYKPSKRYAESKKAASEQPAESASKGRNNKKEQTTASTASTRKSTKESRENSRSTYKVRKGDNLTKIAEQHGTTVAQLKKLNGLTDNNVVEGKVLRVK